MQINQNRKKRKRKRRKKKIMLPAKSQPKSLPKNPQTISVKMTSYDHSGDIVQQCKTELEQFCGDNFVVLNHPPPTTINIGWRQQKFSLTLTY